MSNPFNSKDLSSPLYDPVAASLNQNSRLATTGQFITVVLIWSLTPLAAVWTVNEIHWAWVYLFDLAWLLQSPWSVSFTLKSKCRFIRKHYLAMPQVLLAYLPPWLFVIWVHPKFLQPLFQ